MHPFVQRRPQLLVGLIWLPEDVGDVGVPSHIHPPARLDDARPVQVLFDEPLEGPRNGRVAGGFIGVERVASGPLQVLDDPRRVMHLGAVFVDDVRQFPGRRVVVPQPLGHLRHLIMRGHVYVVLHADAHCGQVATVLQAQGDHVVATFVQLPNHLPSDAAVRPGHEHHTHEASTSNISEPMTPPARSRSIISVS